MPNNFCTRCRKPVVVDIEATIAEISAVDRPSCPVALIDQDTYKYVGADGSIIHKRFRFSKEGDQGMKVSDVLRSHAAHNRRLAAKFRKTANDLLTQPVQNTPGYRVMSDHLNDVAKEHSDHAVELDKAAVEAMESGGLWNGDRMDTDNNQHNGKSDMTRDFFRTFFRSGLEKADISNLGRKDGGYSAGL